MSATQPSIPLPPSPRHLRLIKLSAPAKLATGSEFPRRNLAPKASASRGNSVSVPHRYNVPSSCRRLTRHNAPCNSPPCSDAPATQFHIQSCGCPSAHAGPIPPSLSNYASGTDAPPHAPWPLLSYDFAPQSLVLASELQLAVLTPPIEPQPALRQRHP